MKIKKDKDARRIGKKILNKLYGRHEIHTVSHITDTNVWTIGARTEELEIVLSLDEKTGKMFGEPIVRRTVKVHIVENNIPITDRISIFVKKEYEKINWKFLIVTVGLTIVGSTISAFFSPVVGISISLIFGGLSIWYGKHAFTHYKETYESK